MKTKLLLLTLLAVAGYIAFEFTQNRDPLVRLFAAIDAVTTGTQPVPAAVAAVAPVKPAQEALPVSSANKDVLVLSAPPRDGAEGGIKRFGPIADYLSVKLGRKVVYKHPGTWGGYQSDMQLGAYDIVFDGPHFISWRIEKLQHNVLVKLPGALKVVGFVRADNKRVKQISQLAGQGICAHAPPNLGILSAQNEFDNPSRQPNFIIMEGFGEIYKGVMEGKCVAGIVPKKNLLQKDPHGEQARIVYEHSPFPQQAFTAGPRLTGDEQASLVAALMAPEAEAVLTNFREAYAFKDSFVPANNAEYAGFGAYLKPVQGFYTELAAK
jgi:ABC-type phosphate/phosphonate transport system substrate-binding protein